MKSFKIILGIIWILIGITSFVLISFWPDGIIGFIIIGFTGIGAGIN